jgi:hypothetical protein
MEKLTSRDHTQVPLYEHDEKNDAKRVIIVSGEMPEFKMGEIKFPEMQIQKVEVPFPVKEYEKLEVPVIIKEYEQITNTQIIKEQEIKIVEVPKYITLIKHETIEIPVIVKETEFKEIHIPVVNTEYKDFPIWLKACVAVQALTSLILLLKK